MTQDARSEHAQSQDAQTSVGEAEFAVPKVSMTEGAIDRLSGLIKGEDGPPLAGIRLLILRRVEGQFEHQLTLVDAGREPEDDHVLNFDTFDLFVEARNAEYLDGVEVHWEFKGEGVNGFEFNNPNPIWHDQVAVKIQQAFDDSINPGIAAHGGFVELLDVDGDTAYIELGGGCQGCGMASVTLKQGIEVAIKQAAPEIEHVIDTTDHESGENPYFEPEKK